MTEEEKKTFNFLKTFVKTEIDYCKLEKADVIDILNIIEKLQKENEELKNNVAKRNNELIELEETSEKEFITKQEVKDNYIPKDKIREIIEELEKQEDWYIENKSLDDLYGKIDILKELLEEEKKLIDLMHCEIVYYYVCENDGYYWDGFVVIKCDDKYCVVEYKGSQSGWIKNQLESVDKEFLDNVIGDRKLDNIDDDFPSYFNTFLETTYNYPIPDAIMQQLKDQDAILLDFEDIKKHIKEERNAR